MNFISRRLFSRCKYFKCTKRGLLTRHEDKKSLPIWANCESYLKRDFLIKSNVIMSHTRLCTSLSIQNNQEHKQVDYKTAVMLSKFTKLKLESLLDKPAHFNEESLLVLFRKMCVVYHKNKLDTKFILNLPLFVKSKEFTAFCTLLEKHLPKIMPNDLGLLLNFEIFKIPVDCTLMRKIFTLILDNLNNISFLNILEIYVQLHSSYFKNSTECKKIKEACEVYFSNTVEDEISHSRNFEELISFLNEDCLPISVRKMIMERILEVLNYENFLPTKLQNFFYFAFDSPLLKLYKDQILQAFKNSVMVNTSTSAQSKLINVYQNLVNKNESLYNEEICEIIAEKPVNSGLHYTYCISTLEKLCLIGHFNEQLLHHTLDLMFGLNFYSLPPYAVLQTASVLARTCYHKMNPPLWEKIKEILVSYKPQELEYFGEFSKISQWAEYLTFLECDTRTLLSSLFTFADKDDFLKSSNTILLNEILKYPALIRIMKVKDFFVTDNWDCQQVLNLHHLAKEYFSDDYAKLSKKKLEIYLQNAVFSEVVYSVSHVYEFFGGKDYVITNCTNSHKHFIPMAIILGPDNKPLNLSSSKPVFTEDKTSRVSKEIFKVFFNIENISRPPDSTVIAFMIHRDNQPFKYRNANITSGTAHIFQKTVRNLGCDWVVLPRKYLYYKIKKKVQYLQSQIDEVIKKSQNEKSSNIGESVSKH